MTETEYLAAIEFQRALGRQQIRQLYYDWRRELWPNIEDDPIHREDEAAKQRLRRSAFGDLAALSVMNPNRFNVLSGVIA